MMKRLLLTITIVSAFTASDVFAACNRYNYRVYSTGFPSASRIPQFIICDTEANRPGTLVADGDLVYTQDTDILWLRAVGAWVDITTAGAGAPDIDAVTGQANWGTAATKETNDLTINGVEVDFEAGAAEGYPRLAQSATPPAGDCDAAGEAGRLYFDNDADTDGSVFICLGAAGWKDIDDDGGAGGGAPADAKYIVAELNATLTNEVAPGAANQVPVSSSSTAAAWGTVPIAAGGTGQTSKTPAFDALAPTTTVGDLIYFDGVDNVRLAAGGATDYLQTVGGIPTWVDKTPMPVADGGTGAAPGADDQLIVSDSAVAATWRTLTDCKGANQGVTYDTSTNAFGCSTLAPGDAEYIVAEANGSLSAEVAPGAANQVPVSSSSTAAAWGTVPIAAGGTGQTGATAAFDALAPTTTQGDIIYHNGTDNVRLAKGTAGQVLTMNSGATAPEWAANTGATTYVRLAANSAISSTTKSNLTGMSWTLVANTNYTLWCVLMTTANAVTVGVQIGATFGGTLTTSTFVEEHWNSATVKLFLSDSSFPIDLNATGSQGNVGAQLTITAGIEVSGTGGTLQMTHGSETATLTTVLRGSWCALTRY